MGKTPKNKQGLERRRPYNYPRNAQAQTQNSGSENRNYSYSTGHVPRKIPIYHSVPYSGVGGPLPHQAYRFGAGRGYRGRLRGINKPLKPILNRQRRPDLHSKRILSPRLKDSRRNMQTDAEEHDTPQDKLQETDQVVKNGPESSAMSSEDEIVEIQEKTENKDEIPNSNENCETNGITDDITETTEKIEPKSKATNSKEKKAKKTSPKGKHSPKSKKESKPSPDTDDDPETKETAKPESRNKESTPSDLQPSVKIIRMSTVQTDTSDANDSIVEIPVTPQEKTPTSIDESSLKPVVDKYNVRDSPRRSTRLSVRQTPPPPPPKPKFSEKVDSSSIIVLDSDDSISVCEVSRTSNERSFAQSLRSLSGRPSLRPLPAYNRSSYTTGSASIRSNFSSRSATTSNDSETEIQDSKLSQSRPGLSGLFRTPSTNTASQDSATDNEESTNRSYADDSGNDSEETSDPSYEAASSVSFRKRKIDDADIVEAEQEKKKTRSDPEKNFNTSGFLSIVSSPMNLFASKLRGDKSSTPVQYLKKSDLVDEDAEENTFTQEGVSDIQYEDNISFTLNEKGNVAALSQKTEVEQEGNPRRWCNIM